MALAGEAARTTVHAFEDDPGSPEIWKELLRLNVSAGANTDYVATLERWIGPTVDRLLASKGLIISQGSREALLQRCHVSLTQAAINLLRKAEGDYSPAETLARYPTWVEPTKPQTARQGAPSQGQSISGLFDLWKNDRARNGGADSSARRWQGPIASFIAFLEHDNAVAVTPQDIIRWRMAVIEAGSVAATTFNKVHLAAVKAVFSYDLKPSLKAAQNISNRFNGFQNAIAAVAGNDLSAVSYIVRQGVPLKQISTDSLNEAVYEAGTRNLIGDVMKYVVRLSNGGRDPDDDDADGSNETEENDRGNGEV